MGVAKRPPVVPVQRKKEKASSPSRRRHRMSVLGQRRRRRGEPPAAQGLHLQLRDKGERGEREPHPFCDLAPYPRRKALQRRAPHARCARTRDAPLYGCSCERVWVRMRKFACACAPRGGGGRDDATTNAVRSRRQQNPPPAPPLLFLLKTWGVSTPTLLWEPFPHGLLNLARLTKKALPSGARCA